MGISGFIAVWIPAAIVVTGANGFRQIDPIATVVVAEMASAAPVVMSRAGIGTTNGTEMADRMSIFADVSASLGESLVTERALDQGGRINSRCNEGLLNDNAFFRLENRPKARTGFSAGNAIRPASMGEIVEPNHVDAVTSWAFDKRVPDRPAILAELEIIILIVDD